METEKIIEYNEMLRTGNYQLIGLAIFIVSFVLVVVVVMFCIRKIIKWIKD